jgi:hypothetical protein
MSVSIGPRGYVNIVSTEEGPERNVKIVSFSGRADTGFIPNAHFQAGENPVAIVNVQTGALATSRFGGVVTGGISQTDTGDFAGNTFFAIVTDTGAAGL